MMLIDREERGGEGMGGERRGEVREEMREKREERREKRDEGGGRGLVLLLPGARKGQ